MYPDCALTFVRRGKGTPQCKVCCPRACTSRGSRGGSSQICSRTVRPSVHLFMSAPATHPTCTHTHLSLHLIQHVTPCLHPYRQPHPSLCSIPRMDPHFTPHPCLHLHPPLHPYLMPHLHPHLRAPAPAPAAARAPAPESPLKRCGLLAQLLLRTAAAAVIWSFGAVWCRLVVWSFGRWRAAPAPCCTACAPGAQGDGGAQDDGGIRNP